jgi:hypothetical protein
MLNSVDFKMSFPTDEQLNKMFDAVPKLERFKVLDKTVDAAAAIVVKRAQALAPRSKESDRKKRSKKQFIAADGESKIDWNYPLWKTIGKVIRKYANRYGLAVIGPRWPKGNKAYFNTSPKGNAGHRWGRAGQQYQRTRNGKTETYTAMPAKPRAQVRNWIVQAFDETKPQQLAAMKAKLTELTDQMMRS